MENEKRKSQRNILFMMIEINLMCFYALLSCIALRYICMYKYMTRFMLNEG